MRARTHKDEGRLADAWRPTLIRALRVARRAVAPRRAVRARLPGQRRPKRRRRRCDLAPGTAAAAPRRQASRAPGPDRPGQGRRHRVLGAEPRAADHRRRSADDPGRRVGLQRRSAGTSWRRSAAPPTGASPGPVPRSSGPSPTVARDRPANPTGGFERRAAGRQHALPLRRRTGRCLLRAPRVPGRLLPGDARRGLPGPGRLLVRRRSARPNPRSARSTCTGTAARWKPNRTPAKATRVEDMRALEGHLYESVRIAAGDRVATEATARTAGPAPHQPRGRRRRRSNRKTKGAKASRCTRRASCARGLDFLHLSPADGSAVGGREPASTRGSERTGARARAGDRRDPPKAALDPGARARTPAGALFSQGIRWKKNICSAAREARGR